MSSVKMRAVDVDALASDGDEDAWIPVVPPSGGPARSAGVILSIARLRENRARGIYDSATFVADDDDSYGGGDPDLADDIADEINERIDR